jgi:hypothetical protein
MKWHFESFRSAAKQALSPGKLFSAEIAVANNVFP